MGVLRRREWGGGGSGGGRGDSKSSKLIISSVPATYTLTQSSVRGREESDGMLPLSMFSDSNYDNFSSPRR